MISDYVPAFNADELAESIGIPVSVLDDQARKYWSYAYNQAKAETDARAKALAADSYAQKDIKTPIGSLIAEFDLREYLWLKEQYGPDVMHDYDFIMSYRKYRDQQHLPTPSKSTFET